MNARVTATRTTFHPAAAAPPRPPAKMRYARGLPDVPAEPIAERLDDAAEPPLGLTEQIGRQGDGHPRKRRQLGGQPLRHPGFVAVGLSREIPAPERRFDRQGVGQTSRHPRPPGEKHLLERRSGPGANPLFGQPEFVPSRRRVHRLVQHGRPKAVAIRVRPFGRPEAHLQVSPTGPGQGGQFQNSGPPAAPPPRPRLRAAGPFPAAPGPTAQVRRGRKTAAPGRQRPKCSRSAAPSRKAATSSRVRRPLDKVGQSFYFEVTGSANGTVYGTDVYTSDSVLAKAAVHAGAVKVGKKTVVKVTMVPPLASFTGTTRNGVESWDWGPEAVARRLQGRGDEGMSGAGAVTALLRLSPGI